MIDFSKKISILCHAMDADEDDILPINFSAVGSILLEFFDSLVAHMEWSTFIESATQKYKNRLLKSVKGKPTISSLAPELCFKYAGLLHILGRLLSYIDRDCDKKLDLLDVDKVATFTKSFFAKVEEDRYVFFTRGR
jgi:hypothetical protein